MKRLGGQVLYSGKNYDEKTKKKLNLMKFSKKGRRRVIRNPQPNQDQDE